MHPTKSKRGALGLRRLALGTLVLLGLSGSLFFVRLAYESRLVRTERLDEADRRTRAFEEHRAVFEADHRALAMHPLASIWSPTTTQGRDAGPFLNPRLRWPGEPGWPDNESVPNLTVSAALSKALAGSAPWHAPESVPLPLAELAVLDQLVAYDRWDLSAGESPLAHWDGPHVLAPQPDYSALMTLQRARHAQGLIQGDVESSIQTGRAIARLCFTSSTLPGAMAGVAVLRQEIDFASAARKRGLSLGGLTPVDENLATQLDRAVFGAPAAWQYGLPPIAASLRPLIQAGRCGALGEAAFLAPLMQPWLLSEDPAYFDELRTELEEPGCSLQSARSAWSRMEREPPQLVWWCFGEARIVRDPTECWVRFGSLDASLPGVHGLIRDKLQGIPAPRYFRRYQLP